MKQNLSVEGLEERCKMLQEILDQTTQKSRQIEQEILQLREKNLNYKQDFEKREEEIKNFREQVKSKFLLEQNLLEEQYQNKRLSEQVEIFQKDQELSDQNKQTLIEQQQLLEQKNVQLEQLTNKNNELLLLTNQQQENVQCIQDQLNALQQNKTLLLQEIENLIQINQQFAQDKNELQLMLEDINSEKRIIMKKSQNEIKELKSAVFKEQQQVQIILKQKDELQRDLQNLMSKLPVSNSTSTNKEKASRQEKIILEALSERNNNLELENHKLKNSIQQKQDEYDDLIIKFDRKSAITHQIVSEIYKQKPDLNEIFGEIDSEDLENIQCQLNIQISQQQANFEKTLIENLRLSKDLMLLGQQLNSMIRENSKNK